MFLGEYMHILDGKKRVSLPSKFRKEMGKKVVITNGLDGCLFVYPISTWESVSRKIAGLPMGQADKRGFSRYMFAGAVETDVDSAGRVLIPDFLKDLANLKTKVVIAGVYDRLEVWNDKLWQEYKKRVEKQADVLAEKLGVDGAF